MKANQAKRLDLCPLEGQPCTVCGTFLHSPWGRVDYGRKWVCSAACDRSYDEQRALQMHHAAFVKEAGDDQEETS